MIKIGKFEIEHDGNGWTLWEIGTAISRDTKEVKEKRRPRYFATLNQCCEKIIDLSAANADDASAVIAAIAWAKKEIDKAIKSVGQKVIEQ